MKKKAKSSAALPQIKLRATWQGMWEGDHGPTLLLTKAKGRYLRVELNELDLDDWQALHSYAAGKVEEGARHLVNEARAIRERFAASWRKVSASLKEEAPK